MIQIITMGHPPSQQTIFWAKKLDNPNNPQMGRVKVFSAHLHITNFSRTLEEINELFEKLKALPEAPDLSGKTRTLIVPPGSSTAAMAVAAAWMGRTGDLPEVLNLIRCGPNTYRPSPEMGSLDLDGYALSAMEQSPELVQLHSIKATIRKDRQNRQHTNEVRVQSY